MYRLFLLVAMLLLPGIGICSKDKEEETAGPVIEYIEMAPKFTVNLAEPRKYLLVDIQLLVEGAERVERVKKHMSMLRHQIIMMLSGMQIADLQTTEQREVLRVKVKALIAEALTKIHINEGFQDVFFSEFLVN